MTPDDPAHLARELQSWADLMAAFDEEPAAGPLFEGRE